MLGTAPTQIDARPGGAITLFGGYITGFNLELVSDTRLVQAWRSGAWKPGEYSIARFVLEPQGGGAVRGSGRPPDAFRLKPDGGIRRAAPQWAERQPKVEREGEG